MRNNPLLFLILFKKSILTLTLVYEKLKWKQKLIILKSIGYFHVFEEMMC